MLTCRSRCNTRSDDLAGRCDSPAPTSASSPSPGISKTLGTQYVALQGIDPEKAFRPHFGPSANQEWDQLERGWQRLRRNQTVAELRRLLHWNAHRTCPSPAATADAPGGEGILEVATAIANGRDVTAGDAIRLERATAGLVRDLPQLAPAGDALRPYYECLIQMGETAIALARDEV